MAMFGSEDMTGGAGANFGGMDPMTVQQMMKDMPELLARKRRAEQLRGVQQQMAGTQPGAPNNYAPQQMGGLYQTVQQYQPDYSQIGKAATGAFGATMGNTAANTAEDTYNSSMANQVLGAAQAFGGGNTGGRMGTAPGLDAVSANVGATPAGSGPAASAPSPSMVGPMTTPGGAGIIPGGAGGPQAPTGPAGPNGANVNQLRQHRGMALRGNDTLANLSRWFGQ